MGGDDVERSKKEGGRRAACPHFGIIRVPKDRNPSCSMETWSVLGQSRALALFGAAMFGFCYPIRWVSRAASQPEATPPVCLKDLTREQVVP